MLNIYTAGHLHTNWRSELRTLVEYRVAMEIRQHSTNKIHWLTPMRSPSTPYGEPGQDKRFYVPNDIQMINRADLIAYRLEQNHGNIGGAWEVGYAWAKNIPVYLLDLDAENYKYDILRATSHVFHTEEEFVDALVMAAVTA